MSQQQQNVFDAGGDKSSERPQSKLETNAENKERGEAVKEIADGALNKDIAAQTLEKRLSRKSGATEYGVASADSLLPLNKKNKAVALQGKQPHFKASSRTSRQAAALQGKQPKRLALSLITTPGRPAKVHFHWEWITSIRSKTLEILRKNCKTS